MRILLVITELPPVRSGVALAGAQLAAGYRRAGHQVATLTRRDVGALGVGEIRLSAMGFAGARLRAAIEAADVVHLHGPAPTFADAFLLRVRRSGRRIPIVYTHHFDLDYRGLRWLCRIYHRWTRGLLQRLGAVVAVTSHQYRERFGGDPPAEVVPLGCDHLRHGEGEGHADEASLLGKQGDDPPLRVLFVGQMRPYKGVPVLMEALERTPGVTCRLVGTGPWLGRYRRRASSSRADASFLGAIDDAALIEQLRWAQAMVLPSLSNLEAFGLVLLEGMRFGCVPVGSRLPGVSEVVADCGLLTPPGDAGALAAALSGLRDDREQRMRLAGAARRRALRFTWDRAVGGYLRRLEAVTVSAGARAGGER